jgi:hypothetical protein
VQLALADEPDDVTFLTTAVMAAHSNPIEDPARLLIARRLVGLGLTTPARAALGSRADIPSEEERYILAEIAILEGKRSVATSYLTGLVSEQANQLRDQAEGILSTEAVSRLPETVGDGLTDPADVTPTITEGALAQNRELLNETRAMRDSLLSLLREGSN